MRLRTALFLACSAAILAQTPAAPRPPRLRLTDDSASPRSSRPAGTGHQSGAARAGRAAADGRAFPAEQGAGVVERAGPAVRPEDDVYLVGRPGIGRQLDAGGYGARTQVSLDGAGAEFFGGQSLPGLGAERPVRQSAERQPAASSASGTVGDLLPCAGTDRNDGFRAYRDRFAGWCGAAVCPARDRGGQPFISRARATGRNRSTASMRRRAY